MKLFIALALIGLVGIATGDNFFVTEDIAKVGPDTYFFCVPIGFRPTGAYMMAAQIVLDHPSSMRVLASKAGEQDLSLPKELPVHHLQLRTATSLLPSFDEQKFLSSGCYSATVVSKAPVIKVLVAVFTQDAKEREPVKDAVANCAKFLTETQKPQTTDKEPPKIMIGYYHAPLFAIFSLSAGVILLVCSLISCCCMCARRRRCKQEQCCKNKTACAPEADNTELSIVTEQVPAVQETVTHAPQPITAFYYVPAGAVPSGQYTPMQFVAPTNAYPGVPVQMVPVIPK